MFNHIYRVDINVGDKWGRVEWRYYIMDNGARIVRKYGRRTSWSIANCQDPRVMPGSESRSERWLSRRLRARGTECTERSKADCVLYGGLPCTHQPATAYRHRHRQRQRQRSGVSYTQNIRCYKWPRHRYISSFRFLVSMRTRKLFQPVRIDLRTNGRQNRIHYCSLKNVVCSMAAFQKRDSD